MYLLTQGIKKIDLEVNPQLGMVPLLIVQRTGGRLRKVTTSHEVAGGNLPSHLIVDEEIGIGHTDFLSRTFFQNSRWVPSPANFWYPRFWGVRLHPVSLILSVPFPVSVKHTGTSHGHLWCSTVDWAVTSRGSHSLR